MMTSNILEFINELRYAIKENMTGIKKKCYVNEEKKTIVARQEETVQPIEEIITKCSDVAVATLTNLYDAVVEKKGDFPFDVNLQFGKAICNDGDTFDVNVGKQVARDKCDIKYHAAMIKKYEMFQKQLKMISAELDQLIITHDNKIAELQGKINSLE